MEHHSGLLWTASVSKHEESAPDFSQRATYSYLIGTMIAVNAIKDIYLLVDGPECVQSKTQFIRGNHDLLSTLTSVSGHHRVAHTALHPFGMSKGREDSLRETLRRIASHPFAEAVLLTSMPMAAVTAVDYERLCKQVSRETSRPVLSVVGRSLTGDWMEGYAEVLLTLARHLDLSQTKSDPSKVAIVGYLFDRNEGDHRGNVREIRRILSRLGLETVSIWLEGQSFKELKRVQEAGVILSFPYGRKAADWIARRTGARLIECEYPFGLLATERFVRQVGRETGREELAEKVIRDELTEVVPPLEFMIPFYFQNRRVIYVGDPVLAVGVAETAHLLGAEMSCVVITNMEKHCGNLAERLPGRPEVVIYPKMKTMLRVLQRRRSEPRLSLLVTNSSGVGMLLTPGVGTVELGFPSFHTHWLSEYPFLGFRGFLAFVERLANAMRVAEVDAWARRIWDESQTQGASKATEDS